MSKRSQDLLMALGESIGGNIDQYGEQKVGQAAVQLFGDGIDNNKLNQLFSMFPGRNRQELYQVAVNTYNQNAGMRLKDAGANLFNSIGQKIKNKERIGPEDLQNMIEDAGKRSNLSPGEIPALCNAAMQMMTQHQDMLKKEWQARSPHGERNIYTGEERGVPVDAEWDIFDAYGMPDTEHAGKSKRVAIKKGTTWQEEGWQRNVPKDTKTTIGDIQSGILIKWLNGEKLSPGQEAIKNKYFRGDKDTYEDSMYRWKAKVDSLEVALGRKASEQEKKALFISDPYGILSPTNNPISNPGGGKTLDEKMAQAILKEAGGDKDKARKIAKERGYTF